MKIGLVLPGGGSLGARQGGAIKALIELGHEIKFITGTSVGSLNAAAYLSGGVPLLERVWLKDVTKTEHIHKPWWLGYLWDKLGYAWGTLFKKSIRNTRPLRDLIHNLIDMSAMKLSGVPCYITVVNMNSGELEYIDQWHPAFQGLLYGSAANPIIMEPHMVGQTEYFDGGVREQAPLAKAVELVGSGIDVDKIVIIHTQGGHIGYRQKFKNNIERLVRLVQLLVNENWKEDLDKDGDILHIFPKPNKVSDSMEFPGHEMKAGFQEGYITTLNEFKNAK